MQKPNVKTDDNEQHAKREQPPPAKSHAITRFFDHFAAHVTKWAGSPTAFGAALIAVLIWACTGPAFAYSETWQLVINTGTTIVTFLMVFLIQQNQNKDARARPINQNSAVTDNSTVNGAPTVRPSRAADCQ